LRFLRHRRKNPSRGGSIIELTFPGKGALVNDASEVVKLRKAAVDVGGSSLELADRHGDLTIAIDVSGLQPSTAASATERFCQLTGLPQPD
jgi:hypothetical protein